MGNPESRLPDESLPAGTTLTELDRRLSRIQHSIERAHEQIKAIVSGDPTPEQLDQLAGELKVAFVEACAAVNGPPEAGTVHPSHTVDGRPAQLQRLTKGRHLVSFVDGRVPMSVILTAGALSRRSVAL